MLNKEIKKYIGLTIFAIIIIGIYKSWNTEFLGTFFSLLTPLFIGIVLAYLLYFPSKKIEELLNKIPLKPISRVSRLCSILFVYAMLILACIATLRLLAPVLIENLYGLISQIPPSVERFITYLESHNFMGYTFSRDSIIASLTSNISVDMILGYLNLENIMGYVQGIMSVSGMFIDILIGVIISIYLILDREDFFNLGNRILGCLFRPDVKKEILKYLNKVNEFIIRYIYCRLIDALIMFFVSLIALSLIPDVKYTFALAAIVAVFNIVPYIGSILSTIILIVISLFTSGLSNAVLVGIVMFVLQQIDGNVIAPYLVKDKLKISPVLVLVAVILGGGFGGILGIMVGVPLAAVIRLIANDLMRRQEILVKYKSRHGNNLPASIFGSEDK